MWRTLIGLVMTIATALIAGTTAQAASANHKPTIVYCDVAATEYYSSAIVWAHETGIARGLDSDYFAPDQPISRGQFVTVLYRFSTWTNGQPPLVSAPNPFVDVAAGSYYETPIRWAAENAISMGVDATHFKPEEPAIRAQIAAFLHRYRDAPSVLYNPAFADVPESAWFSQPVSWLVAAGITTGSAPDRFSPSHLATRAQVVTFLWRMAGSPPPRELPEARDCPSSFTAIGDSVMLGVVLLGDFSPTSVAGWTGTVDAPVCRQAVVDGASCSKDYVPSALTTIRQAEASGTMGDVLIIHTGTNGPFTDQAFDLLVEAAVSADQIWFINVQNRRLWERELNATIAAGVARWAPLRRVGLLDWHAITDANPSFVMPVDGTHVTRSGGDAYAALIETALHP